MSECVEREIIAIEAQDVSIVVALSCGHIFTWLQKWQFTAKQWAEMLRPVWVGQSWPCMECKAEQEQRELDQMMDDAEDDQDDLDEEPEYYGEEPHGPDQIDHYAPEYFDLN